MCQAAHVIANPIRPLAVAVVGIATDTTSD